MPESHRSTAHSRCVDPLLLSPPSIHSDGCCQRSVGASQRASLPDALDIFAPAVALDWVTAECVTVAADSLFPTMPKRPLVESSPSEHTGCGWLVCSARGHSRLLSAEGGVVCNRQLDALWQRPLPLSTPSIVCSAVEQLLAGATPSIAASDSSSCDCS